jgi:transposase
VIKWETRVLLVHYLEQGLSKAAIARKLGLDRRTIHRWIASGQLEIDPASGLLPRPVRKGSSRPSKLDPYKAIITKRLEDFPEMTATRLFEEVKAAGYSGAYTLLKDYVRSVRPRPEPEPPNRFETEPAHQAQVDFAEAHFPWGKRFALLVVLGYSRHMYVQFSARQDMRALFSGLEAAFRFFGGVPKELLFDQMASVITADLRDQGERLVENAEFLRFAHHWGFRIRACRPYRARTKGKVERSVSYLRSSFLYGRTFLNDADLAAQLEQWLARVANVRIHGTTGEQPEERFLRDELHLLLPLASRPYRSLILAPHTPAPAAPAPTLPMPGAVHALPKIDVQRRSLGSYTQLAAAVGGAA